MNELDLVEDYPREFEMTQFEKVLLATKRAKALHLGRVAQLVPSTHKHPYMALEEINEGAIALEYRSEEPVPALPNESDGDEDDE